MDPLTSYKCLHMQRLLLEPRVLTQLVESLVIKSDFMSIV